MDDSRGRKNTIFTENHEILLKYITDAQKCLSEFERLTEELNDEQKGLLAIDILPKILSSIKTETEAITHSIDNQKLLHLITQVNLLHTEVDCLATRIDFYLTKAQNMFSNWIDRLKKFLNGIPNALWNFISSMVTPKQWEISGGLGCSMFGLVNGSVQLKIVFQ